MQWLSSIPLTSPRVQIWSLVAVAILGAAFLVQRYGHLAQRHDQREPDAEPKRAEPATVRPLLVGAATTGLFSGVVIWLAGDVFKVFGEEPLAVSIVAWVVAGGAVVGAVLGALAVPVRPRRWWHIATGVLLIVAAVLSSAIGANRVAGYFENPHQVASEVSTAMLPGLPPLHLDSIQNADLARVWSPEPGAPTQGMLVQQAIPGATSGFKARPAIIYLPPAALSDRPPRLPVIIAFSGEPGAPDQIVEAGHLRDLAEQYQRLHGGVSPIVVAPDQLGSEHANPMCLDSKLGNAGTYLTVDVVTWIRQHLPVAQDAAHTAILGFSEGGTCAVQIGFGHPEIAATIVPISSELQPTMGPDTVKDAFGGDAARYVANTPLALLAAHGPYQDLRAAFFVGENDKTYGAWAKTLTQAAKARGVNATLTYAPGTGHDWHTAAYGVRESFPLLIARFGLPA